MVLPAFSAECEKGKCDKEKQEEGTVITGADCDKCKKGDDKKEEGTSLAHCGKCGKDKKDGDHKDDDHKEDDKKKEGTLA